MQAGNRHPSDHTRHQPPIPLLALLVCFTVLLAGCGGDGDEAQSGVDAIVDAASGDPAAPTTVPIAAATDEGTATTDPPAAPAGTIEEAPQVWQVSGVTDSLNVRATPGTGGELIGTLPAGASSIQGTGRRTDVEGTAWLEISWGDGAAWVAATYLAPDDLRAPATEPPPATPNVPEECYRGSIGEIPMVLVARFESAGSILSGAYRLDDGGEIADASFDGARQAPGRFDVVLVGAEESTWNESWEFGIDGIISSAGWQADAVGCADLGPLLDELRASS